MTDARVRALMALARATVAKAAPGPPDNDAQRYVVDELASWFASPQSVPGQELPYRLVAELMELGIPHRAAVEAGRLAMPPPLTGRNRHGSPSPTDDMTAARQVAAQEPRMRALFVLASARRLAQAITDDDLSAQLEAEGRYRDLHVAAGRNRRAAARRLDQVAASSKSGWMVWRCASKPEPECAALNGRLFKVDNPPGIPGAMHMHCRCSAEPWGGVVPDHPGSG